MKSGIYIIRHTSGRCYVGGSVNIADRWKLHRSRLRHGAHHSKDLQADWNVGGFDALTFEVIEHIDAVDKETIRAREQHWIGVLAETKGVYNSFMNPTGRHHQWSEEVTAKRGAALRGLKKPAHWVEARRKPRGPMSEDQKAKLSAALKGRPRPRHLVEQTAAANRGKQRPAHVVEKVRAAQVGKVFSAETRAKMSAAQKARFARQRAAQS